MNDVKYISGCAEFDLWLQGRSTGLLRFLIKVLVSAEVCSALCLGRFNILWSKEYVAVDILTERDQAAFLARQILEGLINGGGEWGGEPQEM